MQKTYKCTVCKNQTETLILTPESAEHEAMCPDCNEGYEKWLETISEMQKIDYKGKVH